MYRPALAAIFLSTSILATSALAQGTMSAAPAGSEAFVTSQAPTEFKASKFVGLDVYGSEGEKIGDITEILLDAQGNAKAVVIGVGGFLGIGQKTVAVPWSSMTWSNDKPAPRTAAAGRPATTGSTTPPAPVGGNAPPSMPSRSPAEQAAYNGYPDHAQVKLTKAQLSEAPDFKYVADTATGSATKN